MKQVLAVSKNKPCRATSNALTPIAVAVGLMVLASSFAVQAQEAAPAAASTASTAPATKAAAEDTAVVTVTGMRAALAQSLAQKRNAESLVEVITAEDVGKMPDKNVADSLQRVAGVNTTAGCAAGSLGENERVSIRGLSLIHI